MSPEERVKRFDLPGLLLLLATVSVFGFILSPIWITVVVSFNAGDYIIFPPQGFSLRWYKAFATDYMWMMVFKNSLLIALPTMLVSTTVGVLAALGHMKRRFRGRNVINLLIMMPFLVPGIIIGISLLMFVHKIGLAGTYAAVVAGHSLWGIPTVFLLVQAVLAGYDFNVDDAARDLGAGPIKTFFLITLPRIKTGVLTAMIFSFITSFGEFSIALFLTAPDTMTMPVQIWNSLKYEVSPIVAAVSTVMILTTLLGIGIGARFIGVKTISRI
ncbi:MAG: ABC transporter permease [Deltaproteobacteria bacterium]|nr:ABC transporter permease [Deltaproteobacteria bacterium]MBW2123155.1 ABC transporter permease [Deltaproteobacteria bacterium]